MSISKVTVRRISPVCTCCGKVMRVFLYRDKSYRGGHYFGKVPFFNKKDLKKVIKEGTIPWKFGRVTLQVMRRDPKVDKYEEYWECPKCYWRG